MKQVWVFFQGSDQEEFLRFFFFFVIFYRNCSKNMTKSSTKENISEISVIFPGPGSRFIFQTQWRGQELSEIQRR